MATAAIMLRDSHGSLPVLATALPVQATDGDLLFRRVARSYARALQHCIEQYDVTIGMWYYLRALWEEDGLTQRELSERVETMEPTTATALRSMEERGLVRRRRNAEDKRKLNTFLTPEGLALREILLPQVRALTERGMAGICSEHADVLAETIGAVQFNLERELRPEVRCSAVEL